MKAKLSAVSAAAEVEPSIKVDHSPKLTCRERERVDEKKPSYTSNIWCRDGR